MNKNEKLQGTSCSKCIFAEWDENKQINCKANRLSKFIERGETVAIIAQENESHFFIKDRICTMCFQQSWLDKINNINNPLLYVRQRILLKCDALILVSNESIEEIEITIKSLLKQKLLPQIINIVLNSNTMPVWKIAKLLRSLEDKHYFQWKISNIEERMENLDTVSLEWCVDHVISLCESPFYSVFIPGFKVPNNFYEKIDNAINDELYRFVALIPVDDWNGLFVQTEIHKKIGGNTPMMLEESDEFGNLIAYTVIDKIHYIANLEGRSEIVMKVGDICSDILL